MPRFSVGFAKRKSTADSLDHAQVATPEQPSFRVIERNTLNTGRSFDGGARFARTSGSLAPKSNQLEVHPEDDNIFANLTSHRGSGISNTTKATSTGNSSRHSNASTAPSSADMSSGQIQVQAQGHAYAQEEVKNEGQHSPQQPPSRGAPKSNSFLSKAGRTFSFGGQKKQSIPPPREEPAVPDLPPVLTLNGGNDNRPRTMTASTTSTATSPQPQSEGLDMGGDFGSMFTTFDKRASNATLTMDGAAAGRSLTNRNGPTSPTSPDGMTPTDSLLQSWNTPNSFDDIHGSKTASPPPVPLHQAGGSFKYSNRPANIVEDEDAKLLQDSFTAIKFLSGPKDDFSASQSTRYRRDEDSFNSVARKPIASTFSREDNMFDGSTSRFVRPASSRYTPRTINPPKNKVMTPAEFERYRQDKERLGPLETATKAAPKQEEEDDDEINYDDDEDELEKSKQQAKQRRKQEAHMTVYRQQMMKVTGETQSPPLRPGLTPSMSAPALSRLKAPSPISHGTSDEEDDEEIPLAILQAHGFPAKNRPPTRISSGESSTNLRISVQGPPPGRPASVAGETSSGGRRHTMLPAFARNLPQDPFVGAGISNPAVRESLSFGDAHQLHQSQSVIPPGGLVGVIANEERSRAMRRGSPSIGSPGLGGSQHMETPRQMGGNMQGQRSPGFDPVTGIPHQMMYNNGGMPNMPSMQNLHAMQGMPGMPLMPPQMLTPGDQAQIQMTQQMQQFMQMQMQFMQMMAGNQNGTQPQMPQPYGAGLGVNQSMNDLSGRHSMGSTMLDPGQQMNHGMRTMSMVQPSSASFIQQGAPNLPIGYTPSIAPSERSNIGLPGRYRPVSHVVPSAASSNHQRTPSALSASLSTLGDNKSKPTIHVVNKSAEGSDDDDEEGWEAMKTKRDKKRSIWRSKKSYGNELNTTV